jgi:hypothetical protein
LWHGTEIWIRVLPSPLVKVRRNEACGRRKFVFRELGSGDREGGGGRQSWRKILAVGVIEKKGGKKPSGRRETFNGS